MWKSWKTVFRRRCFRSSSSPVICPSVPEESQRTGTPANRGAYDPFRELNFVTIVYENMSIDGRRFGAGVVKDFIQNELVGNTYAGMFLMGYHFRMLQGYTNDAKLLTAAADQAAAAGFANVLKKSEHDLAVLSSLKFNGASLDPTSFQPVHPGSAEESHPGGNQGLTKLQASIARLDIRMINQGAGSVTVDQLDALIRQQASLPGRKTILYLSEGLTTPAEFPERLKSVISRANRANVSFYTVDCTGLQNESSSRTAWAMTEELGPGKWDRQESLRELAEGTGGLAMANSNDLRAPLRRAMEDVRSHYELTYRPTSEVYDGHFRAMEMRVKRPGVSVIARKGYYALPSLAGEALLPFEMAALNALNATPPPKAFAYDSATIRFLPEPSGTDTVLAFDVPTRNLSVQHPASGKTFKIWASFLVLIKDSAGSVVEKLSRDIPFIGPSDKMEAFTRGVTSVKFETSLPPGRYTIESAVVDREKLTASVKRSSLVIPAPSDFSLSDVVPVRRIDAVSDEATTSGPLDMAEEFNRRWCPRNRTQPKES